MSFLRVNRNGLSSQIHEYTKAAQVARVSQASPTRKWCIHVIYTHISQPWTVTIFTLDMVMDTVIAVSVIYYLLKSRTSFSRYVQPNTVLASMEYLELSETLYRTNRMVHMLVAYILNSCGSCTFLNFP